MRPFHAAVIGGTHSSVGKTTWSLALAALFTKKGFEIQPFKVGPDYIDPGFQNQVSSPRKSRNLDRFFLSEEYLKECFWKHSEGAGLALVEGVMGLHDGRSPVSEEGSTAEMAQLLGLPVFLVIDGAGLARSAAALVKGYQSFAKGLNLAGVLLNRIASEGHFRWLLEAIEKETDAAVLGWLPNDSAVSIPERHLGLRTAVEEESLQAKLDRLVELLESRFDAARFLELSRREVVPGFPLTLNPLPKGERGKNFISSPPLGGEDKGEGAESSASCRIGVAYDRAFSFYYEDNFDLLRKAGADLHFFSPLSDTVLPQNLDALYLGGGFPELYASELNKNRSMIASIRKFHEEGGLIYAECGGLIYLAQAFVDNEGREIPLAGLIPGKVRMTGRLQHFGYHEIQTKAATFICPAGRTIRSHEFHYSLWEKSLTNLPAPYQIGERQDGFYDGRLLASYQHLHFGQDRKLAENFVHAALRQRNEVKCPG